MHSIASVSRRLVPAGPATTRGLVRRDVAPQSSSTGASRLPRSRWMQAWNLAPLPNASPQPANVTLTAAG
jgi:hypothetical protein